MSDSTKIVLKSFLVKAPPERQERLLMLLSEKEKALVASIEVGEKGPVSPLLEMVHWSWFIPTLKAYPEKEQLLFLSALESLSSENLRQELQVTGETKPLSKSGALFFQQVLLSSLTGAHDRLLPVEFLPTSPLKQLLYLSKKQLTYLIDFLSLYDLAHELRQIVETKILKRIYSFLSEEERKFLKTAMAHKELHPPPRIGLDKWEGSKEAFRHLLHKRGLTRLGAALSGQHPDLVWYVCHRLDIGRGNALFKLSAKEAPPGLCEQSTRQIEELINNPEIGS